MRWQPVNASAVLALRLRWCQLHRVGCRCGLIMPNFPPGCKPGVEQNPVHIIGGKYRYIEPFVAVGERGCQGGASHKTRLYEAKVKIIA
jgi:hypothetical protein